MSTTLTALARGLLQIADAAGMPDSFWQADSRVQLAREVLGVPADGRLTHAHLWAAQPGSAGVSRLEAVPDPGDGDPLS